MPMKNVKIEEIQRGIIKIEMPLIMPFYSLKRLTNYPDCFNAECVESVFNSCVNIYSLLEIEIFNYLKKNPFDISNYKQCALVYVNYHVDKKTKIPDSDNYAYKALTDLIAANFCKFGDAYNELDFHFITLKGNEEKTLIYLLSDWKRDEILKILFPNGV